MDTKQGDRTPALDTKAMDKAMDTKQGDRTPASDTKAMDTKRGDRTPALGTKESDTKGIEPPQDWIRDWHHKLCYCLPMDPIVESH